MTIERLWKVTAEDGSAMHGGTGKWRAGRWRSVRGDLVACERGLHLCRDQDLVHWLGPVIWTAETDGEVIEADDKVVARRARVLTRVETWNERTARLFAAWCAEQALEYADAEQRDVLAATIAVARRYAEGLATNADLSAAGSAAYSATWSAACSAAGSAAAYSAAYSAAGSAACSAAYSAAGSAAYSAAWSAAYSVAGSATTAYLLELLEVEP